MTKPSPAIARVRALFDRWLLPYLPYPHFMAVAPVDTVLRLLYRPFAWIPPQYWPRLALLIVFSTLVTVVSLPERLILAAWLWLRPRRIGPHEAPIFVLGHFRSGTTFLQTVLAADPMLRSPRWVECLAPHAFVVLWTALRYLMIPFLQLTGIEKIVPLAATLPGEDEFALLNWSGASVMVRAVLPQEQRFYDRFHDLDRLTPAELHRWQKYQRSFVEKLVLAARGRRLVLKSPAHMARVRHLQQMFPGAKFIHISRPPERVFLSNLKLTRTLQTAFGLQSPLPVAEQEELAAAEYLTAEQRYLADRSQIPSGSLAEVRLQDLSADPIGEMKRIYRELGLPWSAAYERRLPQVIADQGERVPDQYGPLTPSQQAAVARLAPLAAAFGHDRPPLSPVVLPELSEQPRDVLAGVARGVAAAIGCLLVWPLLDPWFSRSVGILIWPVGLTIAYAVQGYERTRSWGMGAFAVGLTLATVAVHLALGLDEIPFRADFALRVVQQLLSTDYVLWAPIVLVVVFWIASGRPT